MRAPRALSVCLCLAVTAGLCLAAGETLDARVERMFRDAFRRDRTMTQRAEMLESLVKDHPQSKWADDALWALAEMADAMKNRDAAVRFRRALAERETPPTLEPFTRTLPIYTESRVPRVLYLLSMSGNRYKRDGVRAVPFNPLPMMLHEELAMDYEEMGQLELALQEYRLAEKAAPEGDFFARTYAARASRIEARLKTAEDAEPKPKPEEARPAQPTDKTDNKEENPPREQHTD
jgi:tetratricopeptide (TPR) repeat protein